MRLLGLGESHINQISDFFGYLFHYCDLLYANVLKNRSNDICTNEICIRRGPPAIETHSFEFKGKHLVKEHLYITSAKYWMGGKVQKLANFADVQYCIYADLSWWVGQKNSKIKPTYIKANLPAHFHNLFLMVQTMVIRVVQFLSGGYKIRKKSTYSKEIVEF